MLRAWLGRVFNLHPEDWKPLLFLQALIVAVCTVIAAIKTISNALFVSHVGVGFLPYSYIVSALALVASGFVIIPLIDKFPRLTIYRITAIGLALIFGLSFVLMAARQTWVYYLAYVVSNIADSILFLEFWLIAGDLCDSRQAKRVFPLVIGWSLIGGIAGSFGTKFLVGYMRTELLLLVSAVLLLGTLLLIQWIARAFPRETAKGPQAQTGCKVGRWDRFKMDLHIMEESKLVRLICVSLALYSILAFLTDFVFNVAVVAHFTVDGKIQTDRLTAFFGFFDGLSITVSLLFQFFLTNRILRAVGITNAQILLPGLFGAGFVSITLSALTRNVSAMFASALGTRLGQKFLSSSIHRSSMSVVYSPIASEKRGRSKAFAEGIVQPAGVLAAGLLILSVKALPPAVVALIATAFSVVYVLLVLRLRRVYVQQILKMFEAKNFGALESFAGMFARIGEKEILEKLCDSLEDKDFNIRNFVVDLLGEIKSRAAIDPLIELYRQEENPLVKASAIKVLGRLGTSKIIPVVREAMASKEPRIRANAIEAIVESKNAVLADLVRAALGDPHQRVVANAAIAVARLRLQQDLPRALDILFGYNRNGTREQKLSALYAFGEIATEECVEALIEATRETDKGILARAVLSLGSTKSQKAARTLIALLPFVNSAMQHAITASLIKLAPACPDEILKSLHHPDIYSRRHLISVAATMGDRRVQEMLKDLALAEIEAVHRHMDWQAKVQKIAQQDIRGLFLDTFEQLNKQAKENVLAVIRTLAGNTPAIQRIIKDLSHPNRFVRSSALDALEAVGHKVIAKAFMPVLEGSPPQGTSETPPADEELLAWVRQWLKSPYRWIRACGAFTVGRMRLAALQGELLSCLSDSYDLVRANAIEALARFGSGSNRLYIERMLKDPSPLPRRYAQDLLR